MAEEPTDPIQAARDREARSQDTSIPARVVRAVDDLRNDSPLMNLAFTLGESFAGDRLRDVAARRFRYEDMLASTPYSSKDPIHGINYAAWRPAVPLVSTVQDVNWGPLRGTLRADMGVNLRGIDVPDPAAVFSLTIPLGGSPESPDSRPDPRDTNIVRSVRALLGR